MPESPLQTLARSVGSAMTRVADEYHFQIPAREEGSVLSVADGVVRIGGLPGASAEQVLRIGRHGTALVLGLRPSAVEAVLLQRPDQADVGAPVRSFQQTANLAVKAGVEGMRFQVHAPLVNLTKAGIIQQGI